LSLPLLCPMQRSRYERAPVGETISESARGPRDAT
jgi:hypothetical protein